MDCEAFHEAAPELALGIAVGDERAAALEHVAGCAACREELAGLTASVDAVVATAPSVEPPSGFEVRALEGFEPAASAAPRARWALRVAAVAAALVVGVALVVFAAARIRGDGPSSTDLARAPHVTAALTAPGDPDVGTVQVQRTAGDGQATRSEIVVSVDPGAPVGTYRVQCDYESGRPYGAGELEIGPDGLDRWSTHVSVPTYDLTRVRLISTTGGDNLEAEFT